jgi:hypothetical protein
MWRSPLFLLEAPSLDGNDLAPAMSRTQNATPATWSCSFRRPPPHALQNALDSVKAFKIQAGTHGVKANELLKVCLGPFNKARKYTTYALYWVIVLGGRRFMAATGTARGKTKDEAWKRYQVEAKRHRSLGLQLEYPAKKQAAFKEMAEKDEKGDYVLKYRFGK